MNTSVGKSSKGRLVGGGVTSGGAGRAATLASATFTGVVTSFIVKLMSNHQEKRDFYVQIIDMDSFIAVEEYLLGSWSSQEIAQRVGCNDRDLRPGEYFILDERTERKVEENFGIEISKEGYGANLASWSASDGLPYRVHSGRELVLMRKRLKPLSVFTSMISESSADPELPVQLFADLVNSGHILARRYCEMLDGSSTYKGLEVVLYAAPSEAWRLDAYILVRTTARKLGWSEPLIRMEGLLLGYSEWQNDAFMAAAKT